MKGPFYLQIKFERKGTSHKNVEDLQNPQQILPTEIKINKEKKKKCLVNS